MNHRNDDDDAAPNEVNVQAVAAVAVDWNVDKNEVAAAAADNNWIQVLQPAMTMQQQHEMLMVAVVIGDDDGLGDVVHNNFMMTEQPQQGQDRNLPIAVPVLTAAVAENYIQQQHQQQQQYPVFQRLDDDDHNMDAAAQVIRLSLNQEMIIMAAPEAVVVVVDDDDDDDDDLEGTELNHNMIAAAEQRQQQTRRLLLPIALPVLPPPLRAAAAALKIIFNSSSSFVKMIRRSLWMMLRRFRELMADMDRQHQQMHAEMQWRHADMVAAMMEANPMDHIQAAMANNMLPQHATTPPMIVPPVGPISPFLMDLIRENLPCSKVLPGAVCGCQLVVDRCQSSHRNEVYYACSTTRRTPLHQAAAHGTCLCMLQALLAVEPCLASQVDTPPRNTPLHLLLSHGCAQKSIAPHVLNEMVDLLLQLQLIPGNVAAVAANQQGYTPLHLACSAAPECMIPECVLQTLLQANATAASRTSRLGELPLHLHCNRSHTASVCIAQLLVQSDPNGSSSSIHQADGTENEWTPLRYACAKSNTALIVHLVETDPQAASVRAKNAETALHVLCRRKQQHQLRRDADDEHLLLPAIQALIRAAPEVVVWKTSTPLVEDDATSGSSTTSNSSCTPLHYLTRSPSSCPVPASLVQALVQADPSCAAIADGNQYLPLHYACEAGNHGSSADVIACLLSAYPDGAKAVTRKHDTALHLACATNKMCLETVQLLL
jgi:ankyrin repeat protein